MAHLSSHLSVETGRTLVLLAEDDLADVSAQIRDRAGLHVATLGPGELLAEALEEEPGVVLPELGVAIVDSDPEQTAEIRTMAADVHEGAVIATEPETVVWAIASDEYLQGFRAGVDAAVSAALAPTTAAEAEPALGGTAMWADTAALTWGLAAVGADGPGDGSGVTVAVLDTGVDLGHPDLAVADARSFVVGEAAQDRHGHGTHCCGTVAGATTPASGSRFGVAPGVRLLAGKVLSDQGSGGDGGILEGIRWAINEDAAIVSMSLGAWRPPDAPHSVIFETTAQRALARGVLIVAAAGNDARRAQGDRASLGHPANCPSIVAVAAIDSSGRVAGFSNGAVGSQRLSVAGPGVDVRSAWPQPRGYRTISGTSMATPHVAGVAARIAADTGLRGAALRAELEHRARPLPVGPEDVGAGLATIAPR